MVNSSAGSDVDDMEINPVRGRVWMNETRYLKWLALIGIGFVIVTSVLLYNTYKLLPFNNTLWQNSLPRDRGRMVGNLLANNDFTGFSRGEVITWLGVPGYDERLYWYNLGPTDGPHVRSARTPVGDSSQFVIVFRADIQNQIAEIMLDRRPDSMGTEEFDEAKWQAAGPAERGQMVVNLIGHHRFIRRPAAELLERLGPPDGKLFRTQYSVGTAGKIFSFGHALIFVFDSTGHVSEYFLK
jgi:hypothetical protein